MDENRTEINLNPDQQKAVEFEGKPLLIVAGAGTGKTRVITEKIKYLVQEKNISPKNILALTFTEKSAAEMLERVDIAMPLGYEEPHLSTFHSFGERLLRDEALEIGLDPSFKILTPPQAWILIRENLFKFDLDYYRPLGNPTKFISAMLTLFSRAQDEDTSAEEFLRWAGVKVKRRKTKVEEETVAARHAAPQRKSGACAAATEQCEKQSELAKAYHTYQNLKVEKSYLDFGDLILWVLKLSRDRPSVLRKYQDQFKYILVDEFQDTNYAQYEMVKLLAPASASPNLTVVGDDDQSIYKFRGAAVSNILSFKKDYPKAETAVLTKNYRTGQRILDRVYRLIQNNNPDRLEAKLGIDKKLKGQRGRGKEVKVIHTRTGEEEAERVIKEIDNLKLKIENLGWRDFAILARARNHLDSFVAALRRHGIPYQLLGNRGLFDQDEVRDMIAFLKVMANPEDNISFYRLLQIDTFHIEPKLILQLTNSAKNNRKPLWETAKEVAEESGSNIGLIHLTELIEGSWQGATKQPPTRLLYEFATKSGYVKDLLENESLENQLKIKNLNLFFEKIKSFEAETNEANVSELASYLDLLLEAGESPGQAEIEDIDTVNLLTVHAAKGLEFPVVFLVNLTNDRFPTRNRKDPLPLPDELVKEELPKGDEHLQEERRLFYVGCTRAKEKLFLSWAEDYGGARKKKPSPFIGELGVETADSGQGAELLSLFEFPEKVSSPSSLGRSPSHFSLSFLSYSQLECFTKCPLQYKYRYIVRLPEPPSHTLNFGQTIHRTLRDFHRQNLSGGEQAATKAATTKTSGGVENLLRLYERHWIPSGYDSKEHQQTRFESGKKLLREYYEKHGQLLGQPIQLEKKFTLKVDGIPLIGSIDRIDKTAEGLEIVDYKTGKIKDQKEVDRDDQLTIYELAAREALGLDPKKLSLYFVEGNEKVTTTRTKEQLEKKKEDIRETIAEIKKSDFPARPSFLCEWCAYKELCPEYRREG